MKISKNTNKNYNKLINIFGNEFPSNGGTFLYYKKKIQMHQVPSSSYNKPLSQT